MLNRGRGRTAAVKPRWRKPRHERILLVDDDAVFREEFAEYFREYDFTCAADGCEALRKLKKTGGIDLVVMDVRMPGMDGLTLLEKISRGDSGPGVIVITGHGSKDVVLRALRGKADDFLEKPLDIEKARASIEKVLSHIKDGYRNDAADTAGRIEHVKRLLSRNSCRSMSLKSAAGTVCLSPKYLSRAFREHAGAGFSEYRLRLKMTEAKALLARTPLSVERIADKVGYQNAGAFARRFKKFFGVTPAVCRRS